MRLLLGGLDGGRMSHVVFLAFLHGDDAFVTCVFVFLRPCWLFFCGFCVSILVVVVVCTFGSSHTCVCVCVCVCVGVFGMRIVFVLFPEKYRQVESNECDCSSLRSLPIFFFRCD